MKLEAETIKAIEKLLAAELSEYDQYLLLLKQEQEAVVIAPRM